MSCPQHPQWAHGSEDCPFCIRREPLLDKIAHFISWMELNTDFGAWHHSVRTEVHTQLIKLMISDKVEDR